MINIKFDASKGYLKFKQKGNKNATESIAETVTLIREIYNSYNKKDTRLAQDFKEYLEQVVKDDMIFCSMEDFNKRAEKRLFDNLDKLIEELKSKSEIAKNTKTEQKTSDNVKTEPKTNKTTKK